jgi:hypothetical protein
MQEVGQVERFQAAPKETHVVAVKRIFIYLKGKDLSLIAYTDADCEGCIDDQ